MALIVQADVVDCSQQERQSSSHSLLNCTRDISYSKERYIILNLRIGAMSCVKIQSEQTTNHSLAAEITMALPSVATVLVPYYK